MAEDLQPTPVREALVHERFAEHAAQRPDAIALRFEGRAMSYGELERRANQLARHLREEGVRAGALVGLRVERSFEMIVGMLGILKAGGAYVPLDPSYPAERLAFIEADAQPTVVVNAESFRGLASLDDGPLDAGSSRGDVAYVIYTSGSTGKPKGVQVEHRQVARLFTQTDAWYRFGPRDVWTLFHSFAFDFSVWEIWGALAYGGTLVIVPSAVTRDLAAFRELLAEERVTILNQTPSAFYQLMRADEASTTKLALREVIFGGEALDLAALRPWYARHADDAPRLVNMYGITETTVHVTYRPLTKQDAAEARGSLIGTAIPDLTLYVLDEHRHPATMGELYVGGAGLARGYLHRDELTAARFVTSPSGERLYRTGDQVRWLDDGTLEFLGRVDRQVKLRGFRIELGEIESTLGEVTGVRECAVLAREDVPGNKQLVAYWVGDAEPSGLRAHLETKLPAHMVPSAFVRLDAMPLNHNGKLDRAALPRPTRARSPNAPRDEVEVALLEIWRETLGVSELGIDEDFFELGGHSLFAMRVLACVRATFSVELGPRTLFDAPTVGAVAERIRSAVGARTPSASPLVPVDRTGSLPLSFVQEHYVRAEHRNNPVILLRFDGVLRVDVLERALSELVRRQESLRTIYPTSTDGLTQRIAAVRAVQLPIDDVITDLSTSLREHARREVETPLDREHGPLFRARLLRATPLTHVLLFTVDHIACDFWAVGIFERELEALYRAFATERPSPLAELAIQVGDFAVWQRAYFTPSRIAAHEGYWRAQLNDAPREMALPFDRPRTGEIRTEQLVVPLDAARAESLLASASTHGGLFVTLWTALVAFVRELTGQDDVVLGTIYANRDRLELFDLIGCFVNFLVVRTRIEPQASFEDVRTRARHALLDAFEHAELPHAYVVDAVRPVGGAGRNPLCNVVLDLEQGPPLQTGALATRVEPDLLDGPDRVDLRVKAVARGQALELSFRYNAALFDRGTIEDMARRYVELVTRG